MKTEAYDENGILWHFEAKGDEAIRIHELLKAEAEGRLVVLPCKVGDTIYRLWYSPCRHGNDMPDGMECCGCMDECDLKRAVVEKEVHTLEGVAYVMRYWGITYFATREAAEAALEAAGKEEA